MKKLFFFVFLIFCLIANAQEIRVTCIGTSISEGVGTGGINNSFPAQLQTLLGEGYRVSNYGVSGTTMLKRGNIPYWNTGQYQNALKSTPDIVFIELGTNDVKGINRPFYNELVQDSRDMIRSFTELPTHPRVILMLPTASFVTETDQIYDPVSLSEVAPRLQEAAYLEGVELIDMHPLLADRPDLFPDHLHPSIGGASLMAKRLYLQLMMDFDESFDFFSYLATTNTVYTESNYKGFACVDFNWKGKASKVVKPKKTGIDHPWVWRGCAWNEDPQLDIMLLELGFHLVYQDSNESTDDWDELYSFLTEGGLNAKAVLDGNECSAMISAWADNNPDKVLYVSNEKPLPNPTSVVEKIVTALGKEIDYPEHQFSDLIIRSITYEPALRVKEKIFFSAGIKNQGSKDTPEGTPIEVNFYIGDNLINWSKTYTTSLKANEEVVLTADGGPENTAYWIFKEPGDYQVYAYVNENNLLFEREINNNTTSRKITVREALAIQDISGDRQEVTISVRGRSLFVENYLPGSSLSIYDIQGRLQQHFSTVSDRMDVNLLPGVYIANIYQEGISNIRKINMK